MAMFAMDDNADNETAELLRIADRAEQMNFHIIPEGSQGSERFWEVEIQGMNSTLAAARQINSDPLKTVGSGVLFRRVNGESVPPLTHLEVNGELKFPLPT